MEKETFTLNIKSIEEAVLVLEALIENENLYKRYGALDMYDEELVNALTKSLTAVKEYGGIE